MTPHLILTDWAVDSAAGAAGSAVATALASFAIVGFGLTAVIATPLVVGAALIGGVFGVLGADAFSDLLDKLDDAVSLSSTNGLAFEQHLSGDAGVVGIGGSCFGVERSVQARLVTISRGKVRV